MLGVGHFHQAKFLRIAFIVVRARDGREALDHWLNFCKGRFERATPILGQPANPKRTCIKEVRLHGRLNLLKPVRSSCMKVPRVARNNESLSALGNEVRMRAVCSGDRAQGTLDRIPRYLVNRDIPAAQSPGVGVWTSTFPQLCRGFDCAFDRSQIVKCPS